MQRLSKAHLSKGLLVNSEVTCAERKPTAWTQGHGVGPAAHTAHPRPGQGCAPLAAQLPPEGAQTVSEHWAPRSLPAGLPSSLLSPGDPFGVCTFHTSALGLS